MKKVINIVATLIVLIGVNFGLSYVSGAPFIEFSFIAGSVVSLIIWFFTSKGGFTSQYVDSMIQAGTTNFKMERERLTFSPSIAFYTALSYTVISLVISVFMYRSYF